jgi:hypothetical protein
MIRSKYMGTNVGVWIDHRKAIVVVLTENGEEIEQIASDVEKQVRRSGDSPLKGAYESQLVPADDSRQRSFTGDLNIYYDEVIASIRGAESLFLFGPGEAKNELNERLTEQHLGRRVIGIETADKLTDCEIAAQVRQHYALRVHRN